MSIDLPPTSLPVRRLDRLVADAHSRRYWDEARRGQLVVIRCTRCEAMSYPPRPFCPDCWSEDVVWQQVSGIATLYTWSVVRVNDSCPSYLGLPYIAAIVDLEEGPRLPTVLLDVDPADLHIGLRVDARFVEVADDVSLVMFAPADLQQIDQGPARR